MQSPPPLFRKPLPSSSKEKTQHVEEEGSLIIWYKALVQELSSFFFLCSFIFFMLFIWCFDCIEL